MVWSTKDTPVGNLKAGRKAGSCARSERVLPIGQLRCRDLHGFAQPQKAYDAALRIIIVLGEGGIP
jgi:hypothetical protein